MFPPALRMQTVLVSCHVFNSPSRHVIYGGKKGLQYNACNNSLNKYNASQFMHMSATEGHKLLTLENKEFFMIIN
jgi:hypothetical protein